MTIQSEWMREFEGLEKKLREGSDNIKGYINFSLAEAIPHLDRDMEWLLNRLPNNAYAQMEMSRIKYHIIGLAHRERALAVFRYASNKWFKRKQ